MTVLITGTYDTDIITDAGTTDDRDFTGPYARLHQTMNSRGRFAIKFARLAGALHRRLGEGAGRRGAFRRHGVGPGRVDVVGVQQIAACCGDAPHVAARAGHPPAGVDARRGVAADDCAAADGVRRQGDSAAGDESVGDRWQRTAFADRAGAEQGSESNG